MSNLFSFIHTSLNPQFSIYNYKICAFVRVFSDLVRSQFLFSVFLYTSTERESCRSWCSDSILRDHDCRSCGFECCLSCGSESILWDYVCRSCGFECCRGCGSESILRDRGCRSCGSKLILRDQGVSVISVSRTS